MEQDTGMTKMIIGVFIGLLVGGAGGYYVGNMAGAPSIAEQEAANPLADVTINPLEDVKTNPLEDAKTNPFE